MSKNCFLLSNSLFNSRNYSKDCCKHSLSPLTAARVTPSSELKMIFQAVDAKWRVPFSLLFSFPTLLQRLNKTYTFCSVPVKCAHVKLETAVQNLEIRWVAVILLALHCSWWGKYGEVLALLQILEWATLLRTHTFACLSLWVANLHLFSPYDLGSRKCKI